MEDTIIAELEKYKLELLKDKPHYYQLGYMDAYIKVCQTINDYLLEKMKQS
jgi:hypothetical protein